MMREFTEDGWRFRVSVRGGTISPRYVLVQFYDDNLVDPAVEDVRRVEVEQPKDTEEVEREVFSLGPFTWTTTETEAVPYESIEEQVEDAIEQAWERIDEIEDHPSEQLSNGIANTRHRGGGK